MTPVEFDTALQRLRPNSVDFQLQVDDLIGCVDRAFNNALVNFVFDFFERYPNGFYPVNADTSKKADDRQKECHV